MKPQLYTTRGIGTIGIGARFNCPPEVTAITLHAGTDALPRVRGSTFTGLRTLPLPSNPGHFDRNEITILGEVMQSS